MEWLNVSQYEDIPYKAVLVHGKIDLPGSNFSTEISKDKHFPAGIRRNNPLQESANKTDYHLWTPNEYLDHGYFLAGYLLHDVAHVRVESSHFPTQHWPVRDGYFKMVLFLADEPNLSCFKVVAIDGAGKSVLERELFLRLKTNRNAPKLRLAMVVASDTDDSIDAPATRPLINPEASHVVLEQRNSMPYVADQFRMTAYLWQAFVGEQMYRQGKGRRSFQLEDDELLPDTLSAQAAYYPAAKRRIAKVHVLRSKRPLTEWRKSHETDTAKLSADERERLAKTGKPDFFGWFLQELNDYEPFKKAGAVEVSGMLFDSRWDPQYNIIRTHSALGGGNGVQSLGMFGSHCVYSWPSCFERIVPCLLDNTAVDLAHLSNDSNESGEYWRAFNIGAGAMLHELGHAFSLWHSGSGIMSRGYNYLNRAFMVLEPPRPGNTFTKMAISGADEDGAHFSSIDCCRLWAHRCFSLPGESVELCGGGYNAHTRSSVAIQPLCDNSGVIRVDTPSGKQPPDFGLVSLEIFVGEGEGKPHSSMIQFCDFVQPRVSQTIAVPLGQCTNGPRDFELVLTVAEVSACARAGGSLLPVVILYEFCNRNGFVPSTGEKDITFRAVTSSLTTKTQSEIIKFNGVAERIVPGTTDCYKTECLGEAKAPNHKQFSLLFSHSVSKAKAVELYIYAQRYIHGIGVMYDDGSKETVGKSDNITPVVVNLKLAPIIKVELSFGWWLDGLRITQRSPDGSLITSNWIGGKGGCFGILQLPCDTLAKPIKSKSLEEKLNTAIDTIASSFGKLFASNSSSSGAVVTDGSSVAKANSAGSFKPSAVAIGLFGTCNSDFVDSLGLYYSNAV